jgi:heat-inducible transcriptional repressor
VNAAAVVLAGALVGRPLADAGSISLHDSVLDRPGDDGVAPVLRATMAELRREHRHDDQVYIGGTSDMVAAFDAVGTVSEILRILEQQLVVVSLLEDVLDRGLSVAIGTETGNQALADCSLVVAPYVVDGETAGTIGVLGPTRMHYDQALSAVAVVANRLGHRLSEG